MRSSKTSEVREESYKSTDFIWVGGFQPKTIQRKRRMSEDEDEKEEEYLSSDINTILKRWNKQLKEDALESPAKRSRLSDVWQVPKPCRTHMKTSTPVSKSNPLNFQPQIDAFRAHFECGGPDFKIYDDYNYPVTPKKSASYKNLESGNTPAPPLPPRNSASSPNPPSVHRRRKSKRQDRGSDLLKFDLNANLERQFIRQTSKSTFLRSSSVNCLSLSFC